MLLSRDEAQALTRRVLAMSTADGCSISVSGSAKRNLRLASGGGATSGSDDRVQLIISTTLDRKRGSAWTNSLDAAALRDVVRAAESAARVAPASPENSRPAGPFTLSPSAAYSAAAASPSAADLAELLRPTLQLARQSGLSAAVFVEAQNSWRAFATSGGAFAYDRATQTNVTATMRNARGTWSGWAGAEANDPARIDPVALARTVVEKARATPDPVALEPGKYVVLLEPSVVAQMVAILMEHFDARLADEGQNFLSRPGGNKIGERLFDQRVTIYSDPADTLAPGMALDLDGMANRPVTWVEKGVVRNLARSLFWAGKTGNQPVSNPGFYTMASGPDAVPDMIRGVKRGVLVSHLWYVRMVDQRSLLATGLTRDGTFLIENGQVTRPVNNFRFNESPLSVLNNVLAVGPSQRAMASENAHTFSVPPLLVKDFTFSSISPAI